MLGINPTIMNIRIYALEQIARATALGIGASSPSAIHFAAADEKSRPYRDRVAAILDQG